MVEISKIKNGLLIECDCGNTTKLTIDEEGNMKTKTTFKAPEKIETKKKGKEKEEPEEEEKDNFQKFLDI